MTRDLTDAVQVKIRLREMTRLQVEANARERGVSVSNDIVDRVERSLEDDTTLRAMLGSGPMATMFQAMHHVLRKVQRMGCNISKNNSGCKTLLLRELNTRREVQAAMTVLQHAYAATEVVCPNDTETGSVVELWGSGNLGRKAAYDWLEWEGDDFLDAAKGTKVFADWTGDGQELGNLVEAKLLTPADAELRPHPEDVPRSLADIMGGLPDRDRSADVPQDGD